MEHREYGAYYNTAVRNGGIANFCFWSQNCASASATDAERLTHAEWAHLVNLQILMGQFFFLFPRFRIVHKNITTPPLRRAVPPAPPSKHWSTRRRRTHQKKRIFTVEATVMTKDWKIHILLEVDLLGHPRCKRKAMNSKTTLRA